MRLVLYVPSSNSEGNPPTPGALRIPVLNAATVEFSLERRLGVWIGKWLEHCGTTDTSGSGFKSGSCPCLWELVPLGHRAPPWSSGSVLDHRSLPPGFEFRRGHIWRLFHLWPSFINDLWRSLGPFSLPFAQNGRKTPIIIIIIILSVTMSSNVPITEAI